MNLIAGINYYPGKFILGQTYINFENPKTFSIRAIKFSAKKLSSTRIHQAFAKKKCLQLMTDGKCLHARKCRGFTLAIFAGKNAY